MTDRNCNIDAIKGYAIILVVLGHSIQFVVKDCFSNSIFNFIYSFHMPLFMFVSGYLAYNSGRSNDLYWLKKRAKLLLIPFLCWIIIEAFIKYKFDFVEWINYVKSVIQSPDRAYWFLYILFINCVILWFGKLIITKIDQLLKLNISGDFIIYLIIVAVLNVFFWKLRIVIMGMYLVSWHSFFFLMGYYIHVHDRVFLKIIDNSIFVKIICCVLAPVIIVLNGRGGDFSKFVIWFNSYFHSKLLCKGFYVFIRYFVPIVGIYFSCVVIRFLPQSIKKILAILGKYTLEIYVLSNYFMFNWIENIEINIGINTFVPLVISLMLAYIIHKNYLALFLFGKSV